MDFYHLFLKCCQPTSLCVILLVAAAVLRKRKIVGRICFWLPVAILLFCGNGWVTGSMIRHLEQQHLPPGELPQADCIVILGGGTRSPDPPRKTPEVDDAGDRILYGAHLYRKGKAPIIFCTNGCGGPLRPEAEDMAELLEMIGVPKEAIIKESKALNTHEHAVYLDPLFRQRGVKRILLVTSAAHMPRSMAVFKRLCPAFEFVPAPTDFRTSTSTVPNSWCRPFAACVPTAKNLLNFSEAMHEYIGLLYYKLRGWA